MSLESQVLQSLAELAHKFYHGSVLWVGHGSITTKEQL